MPIPKEVLELVKTDIDQAEKWLKEYIEVVSDMRLAGMKTEVQDADIAHLEDEIRHLKVFYAKQKAKSK